MAFSPTSISGLVTWLKADSLVGIVSDGAPISSWYDSGGSGYGFFQFSSGKRPTFVAIGSHNMPAVRFDRSKSQNFISSGSAFEMTATTIFNVFKTSYATKQAMVCYDIPAGAFNQRTNYTQTVADTTPASGWGFTSTYDLSPSSAGLTLVSNNIQFLDEWQIRTDRTIGNRLVMYRNSTPMYSGTMFNSILYTSSFINQCKLGVNEYGSVSYYSGDMSEVIIYGRGLSDTEARNVEDYLRAKYFIGGAGFVSLFTYSTTESGLYTTAPLYEYGSEGTQLTSTVDLYTVNSTQTTGSFPLYINSSLSSNSMTLVETGNDISSGTMSLYTLASLSSSGLFPLYTAASDSNNNALYLYVKQVTNSTTGVFPLSIFNAGVGSSVGSASGQFGNMPLYLYSGFSNNMPLYIKTDEYGTSTWSSPLFIKVPETAWSGISNQFTMVAYNAYASSLKSLRLTIRGLGTLNNGMPTGAAMPLFLKQTNVGGNGSEAWIDMFVQSNTAPSSVPMYTFGAYMLNSGTSLYMYGGTCGYNYIVDNNTAGQYEELTGTFITSSGGLNTPYGGNSRTSTSGVSIFRFYGLGEGTYDLFSTWNASGTRQTNVNYLLYDRFSPMDTITGINQRNVPNGVLYNGQQWYRLGTYDLMGPFASVYVSGMHATNTFSSDAVRLFSYNCVSTGAFPLYINAQVQSTGTMPLYTAGLPTYTSGIILYSHGY